MTRPRIALAAGVLGLAAAAAAAGARAEIVVFDPANYGRLVAEGETAVKSLAALEQQVREAEGLLARLDPAADMTAIARSLAAPALRGFLPDPGAFAGALLGASGSAASAGLGDLAAKASAIRSALRVYAPADPTPAEAALSRRGDLAALDLAAAEAIGAAGAARLSGLETLEQAVGSTPNPRAALDLAARIDAETALIANDRMRIEGLALTETAQGALEAQAERETAAKASAARLALYKAAFP